MKAESRFDTKKAFVLDPQNVKKIWDLLEGADLEVEATLECADGISRKTKLMEEVLGYDNPIRAEIKSLRLVGTSSSISSYSTITLGGAHSTSVSFSLNGHVDKVSELRIKLMDIVDGMKPWYDLFARFDFGAAVIIIFVVVGMYFSFLASGQSKGEVEPVHALSATAITIAVFGVLSLIGWVITRLRRRFFPVAVFDIGQGAKRNEFAEKVRWGVIVAFVVSILAAFAFKPFA